MIASTPPPGNGKVTKRRFSDQAVVANLSFSDVSEQPKGKRRQTIGGDVRRAAASPAPTRRSTSTKSTPLKSQILAETPSKQKVKLGSSAASAYYFSGITKTPRSTVKPPAALASPQEPVIPATSSFPDNDESILDQSLLVQGFSPSSSTDASDIMNQSVLSDTTELTASNFVLAATSRQKLLQFAQFNKENRTPSNKRLTQEVASKDTVESPDSNRLPEKPSNQSVPQEPAGKDSPKSPVTERFSSSPSLSTRLSTSPNSLRKLTQTLKQARLQSGNSRLSSVSLPSAENKPTEPSSPVDETTDSASNESVNQQDVSKSSLDDLFDGLLDDDTTQSEVSQASLLVSPGGNQETPEKQSDSVTPPVGSVSASTSFLSDTNNLTPSRYQSRITPTKLSKSPRRVLNVDVTDSPAKGTRAATARRSISEVSEPPTTVVEHSSKSLAIPLSPDRPPRQALNLTSTLSPARNTRSATRLHSREEEANRKRTSSDAFAQSFRRSKSFPVAEKSTPQLEISRSDLGTAPKSILNSAKKKRREMPDIVSKKSVMFGSPEAAEYHIGSPSVSLTPMPSNRAKAMFAIPNAASTDESMSVTSLDASDTSNESNDIDATVSIEADMQELLFKINPTPPTEMTESETSEIVAIASPKSDADTSISLQEETETVELESSLNGLLEAAIPAAQETSIDDSVSTTESSPGIEKTATVTVGSDESQTDKTQPETRTALESPTSIESDTSNSSPTPAKVLTQDSAELYSPDASVDMSDTVSIRSLNATGSVSKLAVENEETSLEASPGSSIAAGSKGSEMEVDNTVELEAEMADILAMTARPNEVLTQLRTEHKSASKFVADGNETDTVLEASPGSSISAGSKGGDNIEMDNTVELEADMSDILAITARPNEVLTQVRTEHESASKLAASSNDTDTVLEASPTFSIAAGSKGDEMEAEKTVPLEADMSDILAVTACPDPRETEPHVRTEHSSPTTSVDMMDTVSIRSLNATGSASKVTTEPSDTDKVSVPSPGSSIAGGYEIEVENTVELEADMADILAITAQSMDTEGALPALKLADRFPKVHSALVPATGRMSFGVSGIATTEDETHTTGALDFGLSDSPSASVSSRRRSTVSNSSRRFSLAQSSRLSISSDGNILGLSQSLDEVEGGTDYSSEPTEEELPTEIEQKPEDIPPMTILELNELAGLETVAAELSRGSVFQNAVQSLLGASCLSRSQKADTVENFALAVCGEVEGKSSLISTGEVSLNDLLDELGEDKFGLIKWLRQAKPDVKVQANIVGQNLEHKWSSWENMVLESLIGSIEQIENDCEPENTKLDHCMTLLEDLSDALSITAGKAARAARRKSIVRHKNTCKTLEMEIEDLERQLASLEGINSSTEEALRTADIIKSATEERLSIDGMSESLTNDANDGQRKFISAKGLSRVTPTSVDLSSMTLKYIGCYPMSCLTNRFTFVQAGQFECQSTVDPSQFISRGAKREKLSEDAAVFMNARLSFVTGVLSKNERRATEDVQGLVRHLDWTIGRIEATARELAILQQRFKIRLERNPDGRSNDFLLHVCFDNSSESGLVTTFEVNPSYPFGPLHISLEPGRSTVDLGYLQRHLMKSAKPGFGYLSRACDVILAILKTVDVA